MVTDSISDFKKYCQDALKELTPQLIEEFKALKDECSRIKHFYNFAKKIPIEVQEENEKSYSAAEELKNEGNTFFAKKEYDKAFKFYTDGIIKCPQETVKDRELLTILVSNRSATNFELEKYRRVLDDIDYIIEIGDYPAHLKYKLWLRKARSYDELQNKRLASEAYAESLKCLQQSSLTDSDKEKKKQEIEEFEKRGSTKKQKPLQEIVPVVTAQTFIGGDEFLAANVKVTISQDNYQGRYAKAVEDIEAGAILLEENAFCSVTDQAHALTNCQNCLSSVELPISCPGCVDVIFCSTHCCRQATKSFHGVECGLQKILFQTGASVNCLLALRIISQKPLKFFLDKRNKLKDCLKDSCKKNVVRKKVYRTDDYDNVFFLCRNENLRKKEELVHYTYMAIYLLRILKAGCYFDKSTEDVLTEDETFIGGLILRHLQILQFNAHEISELQNTSQLSTHFEIDSGAKYENTTIGAGLYTTLALFNHSCDPSIVRYNIKNKMIVRAIKPIKADDIIYENYGPLYMTHPVEERQETLKKNYWFECLCQPCMEMWPLFKEMNEHELRIPCKTDRCPYTFVVQDDDDPFLTCPYCHGMTSLFPNLKGLMQLDTILPEAEHLLTSGQVENAFQTFLTALELLYKYSRPPHPDIIKVQQRIRTCALHFGNKSFDYKQIL